tara:strand:+ start:5438 stop:5692 length:255 start_codon:yes stop_codon:yes gene_type:complete
MRKKLWDYVKWMLNEATESENSEDLLTEPDLSEEDEEQEEVSAISTGGGALQSTGAISGVTTPLGTDSTYPDSKVGHRKTKKSK